MSLPRKGKQSFAQMREHLTEARRAGAEFEEAWEAAQRRVVWAHDTFARRSEKAALLATETEWRAAFYGEPTRLSEASRRPTSLPTSPRITGLSNARCSSREEARYIGGSHRAGPCFLGQNAARRSLDSYRMCSPRSAGERMTQGGF